MKNVGFSLVLSLVLACVGCGGSSEVHVSPDTFKNLAIAGTSPLTCTTFIGVENGKARLRVSSKSCFSDTWTDTIYVADVQSLDPLLLQDLKNDNWESIVSRSREELQKKRTRQKTQ